jgi:GGDEF domain-containing protein
LKNAVPTDAEQQIKFYKSITGSRTLSELIKEHKLPTSVWIPIVYNLLKYGLVVPSNKASMKSESTTRKIASVQIDPDVIKIAKKTLIKRETGVYSYPACLLFLEQEHKRFLAYRRPYTLLLIRIRARNENGDLEIPSDEILKEVLKIVDKAKRETDILAHYDAYDYALLLPETDETSGQMIASRTKELVSLFRLSEMGPEYGDQQIDLTIGSASAPVDGETIGEILAMALAKRTTLAKA